MTRKELKDSIVKDVFKCAYRGNVIWAVSKDLKIICYEMIKKDGWEVNVYPEKDNPPHLTCPPTFFLDAKEDPNIEWRQRCDAVRTHYASLRKQVEILYTTRKEDEEVILTLNETVDIDRPNKDIPLVVITVYPLMGRFMKNNRLYAVPYRLIKDIELRKKEK